MKILITGITGFIGQKILSKISAADEVFVLCRKRPAGLSANVSVVEFDLNATAGLFDRLKMIRPDVCLHLAWEGLPDYEFDISRRNLNQGSILWRYLVEECGCSKIVSTGSCWEYDRSLGTCREDETSLPNSYFTWAKHSLAGFGGMLATKHKISFIWARVFYAYGPGQRAGSLIPMMAEALKKNELPMVKTPHNANDFIHVDDIAQALVLMTHKNIPTGTYNLGSGEPVAIWKVCEYLEKAMGRQSQYAQQLCEAKAQPTANFWADMSKTRNVLGWYPKINIEEGIQQYVKSMEIKA